MSEILEVLFSTTTNNDHASCSAHCLRTGTDLMKYKGGGTVQPHSLELLGPHYVVTANSTKPLLHVWPINGQELMSTIRFVVPGKVNAMAISPDGVYLVAGIQESIYIWHLTTGRMLNTLSLHYQPVTCIKFTDSGEHFVSAGKDGAVLVWNLTQAVSPDLNDNEANSPLYSFRDHGLAVTDVHIGCGGLRAFMYTVSLDRCCKIYDLSSGTLLLSIVFPVALNSVLVDMLETSVYVGTSEGQIFVFHLDSIPRMKEYHIEEQSSLAFVGHSAGLPVTCLALSVTGQQLISGGEDKKVCVWDVDSRQLIKSIAQVGAVTNLRVRLTNPGIFQPEHRQPQLFAENLKRMIGTDDDECIELLITEDCRDEEEFTKKKPCYEFNFNEDEESLNEPEEEEVEETEKEADLDSPEVSPKTVVKNKQKQKSKKAKKLSAKQGSSGAQESQEEIVKTPEKPVINNKKQKAKQFKESTRKEDSLISQKNQELLQEVPQKPLSKKQKEKLKNQQQEFNGKSAKTPENNNKKNAIKPVQNKEAKQSNPKQRKRKNPGELNPNQANSQVKSFQKAEKITENGVKKPEIKSNGIPFKKVKKEAQQMHQTNGQKKPIVENSIPTASDKDKDKQKEKARLRKYKKQCEFVNSFKAIAERPNAKKS